MADNEKDLDESEILCFVEKYIDSFIVWDIVLYYFHNQSAAETISSLAYRLGRADHDIKACLCDLVDREILTANDGGEYVYTPSSELDERINNFNKALSYSNLRLAILSQVLSKGKMRPSKSI